MGSPYLGNPPYGPLSDNEWAYVVPFLGLPGQAEEREFERFQALHPKLSPVNLEVLKIKDSGFRVWGSR